MCVCPVSLNVVIPVVASLASSVAMDRTTVERERMRKTVVSFLVTLDHLLFISFFLLVAVPKDVDPDDYSMPICSFF